MKIKRYKADFTEGRKGSNDLFIPLLPLRPSVQNGLLFYQ